MKIWFLSVELIVIIISLIVTIRKIKCSRNCGKCKKDVCVKKAELVINPLWVVLYVLGVVSFELSAMLLRGMAAWLGLIIGLVGFLGALFFLPFAYRFNHIGIYFLRCLNKDTYVTRPLSSRHFLWTPVMRNKHNGLPWGFVLF